MNATAMSRIIAALSAITLLGACNDSFSPPPNTPSLEGLTVVPRSATLQAGQVVALKASLIDEHGDRLDGFIVSWRSSNDAVATVASSGEVVGRSVGFAVISASAAGKSQISTIRVLARGQKSGSKGEKPIPN
ncbi:MAG TPA: Ig-like domain-containing protein [Gemmatimonadales bacterium]|nr:Ig-like domain-containing protein [Gemmatimonadales bacterium]